jgi:hypothetical protein
MKATRKTTPRARPAHPKLDPVFKSIHRKKVTMVAFIKAVDALEGVKDGSPRAKAAARRWDVACAANERATRALCWTIPRTGGGLAELADYAASIYINEIHPGHNGVLLLRSIAKAALRLRVKHQ